MTARSKHVANTAALIWKRLFHSVWFFPVILAIPLIIMTVLGVSGSSVGTYYDITHGPTGKDHDVLLNEPRAIRSDEWLVNTQKTIAQAENGYPLVNNHLGKGENMSVIVDVPYKDWSMIFKPHNLSFFILPLENAFALKWWLMGYLLIISCYFFILALLPKKRLLAASLATALFFSAFIQWWYLYGTLSPIYYSLFIATAVIHLGRQQSLKKKLAIGAIIAYLATCFALVLYPPFQIACGLVLLAFLVGYGITHYKDWGKSELIRNLLVLAGAGAVALAIVGAFVFTRMDVIKAATETAYPGRRSVKSGDFYPIHFMSPQIGYQFTSPKHIEHYLIDGKSPSNQSETSNFLLLLPFLFIPSLFLIYYEYKHKKKLDWPLLLLNVLFIVFLLEMFVPAFTPLSKVLLLDKVGGARLLIGLGLMNIMVIALWARNLSQKKFEFPHKLVIGYSLAVLVIELLLSLHAHNSFDHFLSLRGAILFSLPLPLVVYLLLRKRFVAASLIYAAFSIFISIGVNPLYKGLSTITHDPLATAVQELGAKSDKRWVSEGGYLENIAAINGEPSLAGVYDYPQMDLWKNIPGVPESTYNRYAHVGFQVSDDPTAKTTISLITPDSFTVKTYGCGGYLRHMDVGFIITATILKSSCLEVKKTISFPTTTLYIYELK